MGIGVWALSFPALTSYLPERVRTPIWGTQRNDEVHRKRSISWALSVASCLCPSSLPLFPCSSGCLQQRIQYSLQFVKLILWKDQHPQNPFPSSPFCFLYQQFSVFVPTKNLPLLPVYCTGQHALPAPWLLVAIVHVLQPSAKARHPNLEETVSELPPPSCSGSCTLMYRTSGCIPRHDLSASTR